MQPCDWLIFVTWLLIGVNPRPLTLDFFIYVNLDKLDRNLHKLLYLVNKYYKYWKDRFDLEAYTGRIEM